MKAVMQAAWLLTTACGQIVVIVVAETSVFSQQSTEFFFFAALVTGTSGLFLFLGRNYRYREHSYVVAEDSVAAPLIAGRVKGPRRIEG